MYVCMYVCMYVYARKTTFQLCWMLVCIYVYMYVCIYVCMYICMYVYLYVCMYVRMSKVDPNTKPTPRRTSIAPCLPKTPNIKRKSIRGHVNCFLFLIGMYMHVCECM